MDWPPFVETLKQRYLADEASLFLVHGAIDGPFTLQGQAYSAGAVVAELLAGTRDILGVSSTEGLRFPNLEDVGRYDRALKTAQVMQGVHFAVNHRVRAEVLGEIWLALTSERPQGWLIPDIEELYPAGRKRVTALGGGAPPLWDWARHARLRRSNHIVVCFTQDLDAVRPELVEAASVVAVTGEALAPDAIGSEVAPVEVILEEGETSAGPPEPGADLRGLLADELSQALVRHPEQHRPSGIPVMEAVSRVVSRFDPRIGELTFSLGEEGEPVVEGAGGEDFIARWRADIALSASAGMLMSQLAGDLSLDPTGLGALTRRVQRWVDAL